VSGAGGGAALANAKYSRDFEREADDYALVFLRRGGIAPQRFADILRRLEAAGPGGAIEFLATHPDTDERVRRFESP
jgi:predicted Zn-dependent protease